MDATICQSVLQNNSVDIHANGGTLVRIYPSEGVGGLWELGDGEVLIGRAPTCAISLDDSSISRRHAAVQHVEDGFVLIDLQSTNGTQVNGRPIKQHLLVAGDRIRIGTFILKFLSNDDIERQYHETVYKMTTTDGLTNAYTRKYLDEVISREIRRTQRHQNPLCVVMIDIDHFKQINDTYGHMAGDVVLQEFSRRISDELDVDDVLARYGGEEFCLVLSESDSQQVREFTEHLRRTIADAPFPTHSGDLPITASFGLYTYRGEKHATAKDVLDLADQNLYTAKSNGRNRVCSG